MRKNLNLVVGAMMFCGGLGLTDAAAATEPDWLSPSIGPVSPSLHFNAAVGDASTDPASLAVGHHDPTREDGTVQGIELGASLRFGKLEGFATHNISYGGDEHAVWLQGGFTFGGPEVR